jgi:hypothetical protein
MRMLIGMWTVKTILMRFQMGMRATLGIVPESMDVTF